MGQRSQIYVSYSVGHRNDEGKLDEKSYGKNLIPLYFQWNYGSRMVSRARGLVEWLEDYKPYILPNETDKKIRRIAETNFDMRDVVFSADLIQEYVEDNRELPVGEALCDIFEKQGNNDGKFFLSLEDDGSFKYAFTDREITKPMTAEQYMEWGDYEDEEPESNLKENLEYLENNKNLKLMTEKELHAFIN
ncbi:hypothetical protein IKQ26_03775, partial [bacterium]|nr:hypothetical protein [bacterium]